MKGERAKKREKTYAVSKAIDTHVKSKEMENEIKKKIKLASLGIGVISIRKRQNGLIILCPTRSDADIFSKIVNEKFALKYNAELLKKRLPRIIIKYLTRDFEVGNIGEDIKLQNPDIFETGDMDDEIPVKRIIPLKNNASSCHVIIEVKSHIRRKMIERQKINLGYQRLTVADEEPLVQCFHCLRVGHMAAKCLDSPKPGRCSHCGGDHGYKACDRKQEKPNCSNCMRDNGTYGKNYKCDHDATDKVRCFYMKRMMEIAKEKIEY
jgi:hypothetical protein